MEEHIIQEYERQENNHLCKFKGYKSKTWNFEQYRIEAYKKQRG